MLVDQPQISFWYFPCPLSGDIAVTIFIQGTLTYLFTSLTLQLDYYAQRRVPWRTFNIPSKFVERIPLPSIFLLPHLPINPGTRRSEKLPSIQLIFKFLRSPMALIATIISGLVSSAIIFLPIWPISVAILAPLIGGRDNLTDTWWPEGIKGVFGFVLNMVQAPLLSIWVVSMISSQHVDKRRSYLSSCASNSPMIDKERF